LFSSLFALKSFKTDAMAYVDIDDTDIENGEVFFDPEDYIDELSDEHLLKEIKKRGYIVRDALPDVVDLKINLLNLLGLMPYNGKEEIINKVKELLVY
jgi:hypothetical protein